VAVIDDEDEASNDMIISLHDMKYKKLFVAERKKVY